MHCLLTQECSSVTDLFLSTPVAPSVLPYAQTSSTLNKRRALFPHLSLLLEFSFPSQSNSWRVVSNHSSLFLFSPFSHSMPASAHILSSANGSQVSKCSEYSRRQMTWSLRYYCNFSYHHLPIVTLLLPIHPYSLLLFYNSFLEI